ncbi:hypothetical protein [Rubidibacter lacunae]|nr:hypothetical protein [Rubidibacter lacunae]
MSDAPSSLVDLGNGIKARTAIPESDRAALRSGFAGYPPNPRWSAAKHCAWRTGTRWRSALQTGDLVVRSRDALLVNPAEVSKLQPTHSLPALPLHQRQTP